ncbi:hypothetical protein T261_8377 [Streptomyces lydicus]|nr:hypothetical protein T261_8377 [Streptomyces lydicus]
MLGELAKGPYRSVGLGRSRHGSGQRQGLSDTSFKGEAAHRTAERAAAGRELTPGRAGWLS